MSFLQNLHWRYATKKFDANRKVSQQDLETILEAIRMTPTSYGMQPYHFYVITNQDIKNAIKPYAWNQDQIDTCSHLIVFTARTDLSALKEEYLDFIAAGNPVVRAGLAGFDVMLTRVVDSLPTTEATLAWTGRQLYIAHGFALAACAELGIDSCPIEGVDDWQKVEEIIGIPAHEKALVMLPIGYRAEGEAPRTPQKIRFSKENLFTFIDNK